MLSLAAIGLAIAVGCSSAVTTPASQPATNASVASSPPAEVPQLSIVNEVPTSALDDSLETPIAAATTKPSESLLQAATDTVEADPNYESELRSSGLSTSGWRTEFEFHNVAYTDITPVIRRDGIPAIDSPTFVSPDDANDWLRDEEPVIALNVNGDFRAYPLQILTWHEIVNDEIGGVPVAVTFCPLCNSAVAFDRRLGGTVYDFGVSGNLRNSDLIIYDRQTHSWWQQFTGEGIVGTLAGSQLNVLSAAIVSYEDFKQADLNGRVLSRNTGFSRQYGRNPYAGYDEADNPPFLFDGDSDGRLLPKERVVAVTVGDVDAAFPFSRIEEEGAINYTVNGQDLAVFFNAGTASALDKSSIADSRDIGATGVFDPNVDGQKLTFSFQSDKIVDEQTQSTWDIFGRALEGSMAGTELTRLVHADHFWFAWAAFKPDTLVYGGQSC